MTDNMILFGRVYQVYSGGERVYMFLVPHRVTGEPMMYSFPTKQDAEDALRWWIEKGGR